MPLIEVGRKAPRFELVDQHGEVHRLADYGGRWLVICFYPKDETPTCTVQACQIRDHRADFSKLGASVVGISPDDERSHEAFARRHALDYPLLADDERDRRGRPVVCAAYGTWVEKSMFGRTYMGVVRTTYLIDPSGVVRARWDRVKVNGHMARVLGALRELSGAPNGKGKKLRRGVRDSDPPYQPVRGMTGAKRVTRRADSPVLRGVKAGAATAMRGVMRRKAGGVGRGR